MAKVRRPRVALGTLVRTDGVRVEVKNPTVWKQLTEQQSAIAAQRELLQQMQGAIAKVEAERDRLKALFEATERAWWTRFGITIGMLRIDAAVPLRQPPSAGAEPPATEALSRPPGEVAGARA